MFTRLLSSVSGFLLLGVLTVCPAYAQPPAPLGPATSEPYMSNPAPNPVWGYFRDRALDLIDISRVKIHFGSVGAAVRATALIQVGAVYTDGFAIGHDRRAVGMWYEYRLAGGLSAAYHTDIETSYIWGNEFADPLGSWNQIFPRGLIRSGSYFDDGRNRPFSIGAEAHLLLGVDIGIYPAEIVDFLLGIFGADILEDDLSYVAGDPFFTQPPPGSQLPPL